MLEGSIENLTINGVDIDAGTNNNVGAIVGTGSYYGMSMYNCHVIFNQGSIITGNNYVGGIVGVYDADNYREIADCKVISNIDENVIIGNTKVGGLIGAGGKVSNCHVQANIAGTDYVGGIVGASGGTINNSSYKGTLTGSTNVGGIAGEIGEVYASKVEAVINAKDYAGGIVGLQYGYKNKIIGCYSSGTINRDGGSGNNIGRIAGWEGSSQVQFNYTTMTSNYADCATFVAYGGTKKDCAAVTSRSEYDMTNCQLSCTNITEFLQNCYSEHADYFNFNNTWTWTGTINGKTENVSCPKLYWED